MTALASAPEPSRSKSGSSAADLNQTLLSGIECHRAGNFADAEDFYTQVIAGHPTCFEALYFLSVLRLQQGRFHDAVPPATAAARSRSTSAEALAVLGVALANVDRHSEAVAVFERAIALQPESVESICNRAASLAKLYRHEEAVAAYRKALALRPGHPPALLNLGNNLAMLRHCEEALACYKQLLSQGISTPDLLNNVGNALFELDRGEEALEAYQRALANSPDHIEVLNNCGRVLSSLERHQQALEYYDKVLRLAPGHVRALTQRGRACAELGHHLDALASFEAVLKIEPGNINIVNNRCVALQHLNRFDEAMAGVQRALALDPANVTAHYNHGNVLQALNRCEEAVAAYQSALASSPGGFHIIKQLSGEWLGMELVEDEAATAGPSFPFLDDDQAPAKTGFGSFDFGSAEDWRYYSNSQRTDEAGAAGPGIPQIVKNLGGAWLGMERHDEAIACFEQAAALGGDDDQTRTNKSLAYLNLGRFAEGWADYDCRLSQEGTATRRYSQPRWDGEHVDGTLLVWGEQGLGDQIIYASMIEEVASCANSVLLEVKPRLESLFRRSFPKIEVIAIERELYAGPIAAQTPIGSLGRYLRPDWQSFPQREHGFLRADPIRTADLRERLADGRRVIGLSWRSHNKKLEKFKTAQLRDFEPLLRMPNCRFIDLQYGDTSEERAAIEREFGVCVENLADIDNQNDIDGLAALISACDKVVTVSNTTAHLAGALGRDTVVLVPSGHARLWYWFKDRDDSPWYPRVQLKRQGRGQPWAELASGVADEMTRQSN